MERHRRWIAVIAVLAFAAAVIASPAGAVARNGKLFGFADAHLHITANLRAGGDVLYGEPFDARGIAAALGGDADVHGPSGLLDVTGNLLRTGIPLGSHDTHGWPTFAGWPAHDTYTHQQVYWTWLRRAWAAGERLVVAQTVEDEPLCEIEPIRSHSCDETETIKLEVDELRDLEQYLDARAGGPGRGFFRLVYTPRQAARAIEDGKLAVVIGVEASDPFGCSERFGVAQCTRADVDRGIALFRRWGIRSMFIAHWVDNAFAGAALEGGAKGAFINVLNEVETGQFFSTGTCPEPGQGEEVTIGLPEIQALSGAYPALAPLLGHGALPLYPPGKQCNAKGLTPLGAYLVRRLIANHMLIEVDHLSERARLQVLAIAERHRYPLVSSHTDTGGFWTPRDLRRLYRLGGFASATLAEPRALARKIAHLRRYAPAGHPIGVPLGTDTGGFNALPGPPAPGTRRLRYPFLLLGGARLTRQRTGARTFDLNTDGVAHYGLVPDLLADMQRHAPGGRQATGAVFRSAATYLRTWRRAYAR